MRHLLFVAIMAMFAQPYHNITEEIFLNEDGSGKYNIYIDEVPAMKQAIIERFKAKEALVKEEAELEKMAEEEIWSARKANFNQTTNILKSASEEVLADPEKKKILKNMIGFSIGNKTKNTINTGVMCKFNNLEELGVLMDLLRTNPLRDFKTMDLKKEGTKIQMANNKFSKQTPTSSSAAVNTSAKMGKFKSIVFFPSKIKKAKDEHLKEQKGQMLVFEYDLADVLSGKVDTSFEVKLEK